MASNSPTAAPVKVKPKLRGVSHFIAFCIAVAASTALVWSPKTAEAYVGGVTYAASVLLMFGVSAFYHRPMWTYRARRVLRRLDHSGIFFLIVGSATAFWTLASAQVRSPIQLWGMWIAAIAGALGVVLWTDMPRALRAGSYVALGFGASPLVLKLPAIIGWPRTAWVIAGAAIYILGAVVYARRWPNPNPRVFGYHEVFHVMVVVAAAIHFAVIVDLHWVN
jgi:hemolysin III